MAASTSRAVVVLQPEAVVPGQLLQALLHQASVSFDAVDVVSGPAVQQASTTYSTGLAAAGRSQRLSRDTLASLLKLLSPGASVYVAEEGLAEVSPRSGVSRPADTLLGAQLLL